MSKKIDADLAEQNDLLKRQNELIEQNSLLLEQQNKILQQNLNGSSIAATDGESFVENINTDEMRSGFLVTSHRKKLWNVQIGLLNEVERICKKYQIRYFVAYGTLIGAVRHKGFIPWDDDIDLIMFRPEYEKFKKVAPLELKSPYFFDACYNYKLESEGAINSQDADGLQFVSRQQEQLCSLHGYWPFWTMIKIRDIRTSMIQYLDRPHVVQGIWIDIFPYDPVPPFSDDERMINFQIARELWIVATNPAMIINAINCREKLVLPYNYLTEILGLTYKNRMAIWESFMSQTFFDSQYVGQIRYQCLDKKSCYETKDFSEIEYVPFEKIEVPIPKGYDGILRSCYGDWHKFVYTNPHIGENFYSADIPYKEFVQKSAFMK